MLAHLLRHQLSNILLLQVAAVRAEIQAQELVAVVRVVLEQQQVLLYLQEVQ
jgi:hypothetical protein